MVLSIDEEGVVREIDMWPFDGPALFSDEEDEMVVVMGLGDSEGIGIAMERDHVRAEFFDGIEM